MATVLEPLNESGILTKEQYEQVLEDRCQAWLGMTLDEFVRAHGAGELPDTPAVGHILLLLGVQDC